MQDKELIQETWNKKRIIIGVIVLILLGIALFTSKKMFLDKYENLASSKVPSVSRNVKGINSQNVEDFNPTEDLDSKLSLSIPKKIDIQSKLDEIKEQVNSLNASDIASSSPQVQKIINDFQSLQELPKNQVKEACYNICKGL